MILNYVYKNKLGKTCFAHNVVYADSKNLAKKTVSHKVLKDRANEFAGIVYKCFDKKTGLRANTYQVLAQYLRKPVIKKFKRRKVYSRLKNNTGTTNLAEMRHLSCFNFGIKYLLSMIDVFNKYA